MKNKKSKIKLWVQFLGSRLLVHAQIHALCMFSADENFTQSRNEYESLKATLLTCFQHPQAPGDEHKIVVAVLSKYVTTILANQIHKILNLAFHPETVENVAPDGSTWQSAANVSKVLHAETVLR